MDDALAPTSGPPSTQSIQEISFSVSKRLAFTILVMTLNRIDDISMRPHWHAWMVFLSHIIGSTLAVRLIENDFPWAVLVEMLNGLLVLQGGDDVDISAKMVNATFPSAFGHPQALPEDYNLHGFDWAQHYFPPNWFEGARMDSAERTQGFPSMANPRRERILWLAARICGDGDWLAYSAETRSFTVHPALRQRIEASKAARAMATFHRDKSHTMVLSDVDMATVYGHSGERKSAHIVTPETIAEVTRLAMVKGTEALHPGYTAYVVDTNLLVAHLETFSQITDQGWPVVVPTAGNITPPLR